MTKPKLGRRYAYAPGTPLVSESPRPEEIKRLRFALGATQETVAKMLHASPSSVVGWEAGRYRMPPVAWAALQLLAGKHPSWKVVPRGH